MLSIQDRSTETVRPLTMYAQWLSQPRLFRSWNSRIIWSLTGNIVFAGCQWGHIIVIAKLGGSDAVGQFGLALALLMPFVFLASMELRTVQATDSLGKYSGIDYVALRLGTAIATLAATFILMTVMKCHYDTIAIALAWGVAKSAEGISDISYGYLQRKDHFSQVSKIQITSGMMSLLIFSTAFAFTHDLIVAAISVAALRIIINFAIDLPLLLSTDKKQQSTSLTTCSPSAVISLAKFAMPLGITMAFLSFRDSVPRLCIESLHGERTLGVFVALAHLLVIGGTIGNALNQPFTPSLAQSFDRGTYRRFISLLLASVSLTVVLGATIAVGIYCYGIQLIAFLYTNEFTAGDDTVFLWIAIAVGPKILAGSVTSALRATKRYNSVLATAVCSAILLLSLSPALVEREGVVGAVKAIVACSIFDIACSSLILWFAVTDGRTSQPLLNSDNYQESIT